MVTEWEQKILSKVSPEKRHGSIFTVAATYQDDGYARIVAQNIEQQKSKRKQEAAA